MSECIICHKTLVTRSTGRKRSTCSARCRQILSRRERKGRGDVTKQLWEWPPVPRDLGSVERGLVIAEALKRVGLVVNIAKFGGRRQVDRGFRIEAWHQAHNEALMVLQAIESLIIRSFRGLKHQFRRMEVLAGYPKLREWVSIPPHLITNPALSAYPKLREWVESVQPTKQWPDHARLNTRDPFVMKLVVMEAMEMVGFSSTRAIRCDFGINHKATMESDPDYYRVLMAATGLRLPGIPNEIAREWWDHLKETAPEMLDWLGVDRPVTKQLPGVPTGSLLEWQRAAVEAMDLCGFSRDRACWDDDGFIHLRSLDPEYSRVFVALGVVKGKGDWHKRQVAWDFLKETAPALLDWLGSKRPEERVTKQKGRAA